MSTREVQCPSCGRITTRKKRCMYCYALLPPEEMEPLGGTGTPYWQKTTE